jgi:hypothetical protein
MNRLEATQQVLLLEAAAAQLKERAKAVRLQLDADARYEFEKQGAAPTWRLADLGAWSLPVSREAAYVADPAALAEWVKQRYPSEIREVVNPAFQTALLARLAHFGVGDAVIDPATGEVVPGLGVRPGGQPLPLRFKANGDALAMADQVGAKLAGQILDGLGLTAGGATDAAMA